MPSCFQLVASQKLHDLRLFAKLQGSSKLILFFTCFPSIFSTDFHASLSLSCSHKMFALFGAFCLLLLQATLTPAQVSLAKIRARITCLHFQKVDRPKPLPPSSPVVDHHLLVNSFGRLVRFVCEISQIFQLSRWF